MLVCHCTLPYTNPSACKNCSRYLGYLESTSGFNPYEPPYDPGKDQIVPSDQFEPQNIRTKKITRTIEKYSKDGRYLGKEVIIEEEEVYDKKVYFSNDVKVYYSTVG